MWLAGGSGRRISWSCRAKRQTTGQHSATLTLASPARLEVLLSSSGSSGVARRGGLRARCVDTISGPGSFSESESVSLWSLALSMAVSIEKYCSFSPSSNSSNVRARRDGRNVNPRFLGGAVGEEGVECTAHKVDGFGRRTSSSCRADIKGTS